MPDDHNIDAQRSPVAQVGSGIVPAFYDVMSGWCVGAGVFRLGKNKEVERFVFCFSGVFFCVNKLELRRVFFV